jgi:hypothetical protein
VELIADGNQILVGRIRHHFGKLRRRNAIADDVDFAFLQAQDRDRGVLTEFKGETIEIGNTLAEIVGIAFENDALARNPLDKLESACAASICGVRFRTTIR